MRGDDASASNYKAGLSRCHPLNSVMSECHDLVSHAHLIVSVCDLPSECILLFSCAGQSEQGAPAVFERGLRRPVPRQTRGWNSEDRVPVCWIVCGNVPLKRLVRRLEKSCQLPWVFLAQSLMSCYNNTHSRIADTYNELRPQLAAVPKCLNNMVWSECTSVCPKHCKNAGKILDPICSTMFRPGCSCPSGMFIYKNECVSLRGCPCTSIQGKEYKHGETVIGKCGNKW